MNEDYEGIMLHYSDYQNRKNHHLTQDERIYYITFRKNGKPIKGKVGRQYHNDMIPARANNIRSEKMEGRRKTNSERRAEERQVKEATNSRWTLNRLFGRYLKERTITDPKETDDKDISDSDIEKMFAELNLKHPLRLIYKIQEVYSETLWRQRTE
jgi:hypothetical protein